MLQEILLIGGGGHCKACIDVLQAAGIPIYGIVDNNANIGDEILGVPIVGNDEDLSDLKSKVSSCLITVGQIKNNRIRKKLFSLVQGLGFKLPIIISPNAYVSPSAVIGQGSIIMHGACINANSKIGTNCIINSKALIEHDCQVGNQTHISTGSILNGEVIIGSDSFIGSGTIIYNRIQIENNTVLSAGSIVQRNITKSGTYFGNVLREKK